MPLYRRIPKRGFKNSSRRDDRGPQPVDLDSSKRIGMKEVLAGDLGCCAIAIKGRYDRLTILGTGELTKAVVGEGSQGQPGSLKEKIKKAGGKRRVAPDPGPAAAPKTRRKAKKAAAGEGLIDQFESTGSSELHM